LQKLKKKKRKKAFAIARRFKGGSPQKIEKRKGKERRDMQ
jgi:hypothetical protein